MKHPNLVWEGRRTDGRLISCLVLPAWPKHAVLCYLGEVIEDAEEFEQLEVAQRRAQELKGTVLRYSPG